MIHFATRAYGIPGPEFLGWSSSTGEQGCRASAHGVRFLLEGDHRAVQEAASGWADAGLTVRVVRGRKMRTMLEFFDEFAAGLQFPWYFGENRDAFEDCY